MTSRIKENLLFYLAGTREKSRSIAIGHDLSMRSDLVIKLLIKNCRFKFDLLLMDGLRSTYSDQKLDNIYSFFNPEEFHMIDIDFEERMKYVEKSICNVFPDTCLIVDSINLLILNYNPVQLNKFINHLLTKYCKIIVLFNNDLVELDYLIKIQEIFSSYFHLERNTCQSNDVQVQYIHKKKSLKLGLEIQKDNYLFTFDTNTLIAKLIESKSKEQQTIEDYSYDLSFKVTMKDDEKREQNVLPFIRAQNNTSKVYYVPDKFDDVDEEDPDDDLLI